jgi:hypothetical protein
MILKKFSSLLLICLCLIVSNHVFAQPTGDGVTNPDDPLTDLVPLDGGLSILMAAGAVYGIKKAYNHKSTVKNKNIF